MLKTYLSSVHLFCFSGRRMQACPSEDGRTIAGKASSIPVSCCASQLRPACAAASGQEEAVTHFLRPVHWPGPFQAGQGYSGVYRASSQHPSDPSPKPDAAWKYQGADLAGSTCHLFPHTWDLRPAV